MLQDLGLDVSTARNGQEAIDQFKESKLYTFDYIFMDIMMPIKNGLETTREIRVLPRRDVKSVHILAMSANAFESDIQECLKSRYGWTYRKTNHYGTIKRKIGQMKRVRHHPFSLHMALNNLHSKLKSYYRLYELHSLLLIHAKYG